MSKATKRKHVTKELEDNVLEIPNDKQAIVRLIDSRGNNLHEVIDRLGESYLVSMPVKFRRNVWVKRGDFVLVETIPEGDKVKAEIVKILTKDHRKFYKSQNCWPEEFNEIGSKEESAMSLKIEDENESSEDNADDDLFVNTNRQPHNFHRSRTNTSSSESSESD
ncbi:probable RNA-binding protein EIF1AD [Venturia canescens]|uniref:probable RNA-binding protein EIF1AD n=1 Tax=Venturia canescens TaxID=32260 RepID=UPI001C9C7816|nr:probable RNA-binding protein EIF1AD [Venturia canescens]